MYKYLSVFLAVAFLSLVGSSTASAGFALYVPQAEQCSDPSFQFMQLGYGMSERELKIQTQNFCGVVADARAYIMR